MKCSKPGVVLALLVTATILLADRAAWASVAQWREDTATNLWLGYTRSPLDQVTQFLPLVLLIWFSIPFVLESSEYPARLLRDLTCVSSISYTLLSLAIGTLVVVENLGYRGNVLPTADVPLFDKLHVVDFVARDWRSRSVSKEIPVDYDLGDRNWD